MSQPKMIDDDVPTPVTTTSLPQKKFYRQRAHCNPLSDSGLQHPLRASLVDWSNLFPNHGGRQVEFLDVGCGYGGLMIKLAELYPHQLILGMEIRDKVSAFVRDKIASLRRQQQQLGSSAHTYDNVAVVRTNAMKYLPNYIGRGQLRKLFILFPDPHFKRSKHRWRIVSRTMLDQYAFVLDDRSTSASGVLYTITDVEEVHEWICEHFDAHPLFRALEPHELRADPIVELLSMATEEGQKVTRMGGRKFTAVYARRRDNSQQQRDGSISSENEAIDSTTVTATDGSTSGPK